MRQRLKYSAVSVRIWINPRFYLGFFLCLSFLNGGVPLILVWESEKVPICFLFFLGLIYSEVEVVNTVATIL